MHKFGKAFVSVVLGGVFALSFTMTACTPEEQTPDPDETETHTHTYSDEWVYNSTQHWHPASCDDTNSVSDQADHVDEDGDSVCDVCGWNYAHTHVFDDEWSYDETNHWHAALCNHDATADTAAHTANEAGVCTVCGYQVSTPDVSTVEDALVVAEIQNYLAEHGEGDIVYYNGIYGSNGRTSYYSLSYDIYEDYTYTYYESSYSTIEMWNSLTSNGDVFSVVSDDGGTPYRNTESVPVEALNGYDFTDGFNITNASSSPFRTYYGITDLVTGLYFDGEEYLDEDLLIVPGEDSNVYSFTLSNYSMGYTTNASGEQIRDTARDYYYVITVEFTLSSQYYISTANILTQTFDSDSLKFDELDPEGEGTLKDDATPYIQYSYTLEQGGRNPYVYEEVMMTDFDIVDANGNVVNGDADVAEVQITPYMSTAFTITNILPTTADISLDRITVDKLEVYNENSEAYTDSTTGWNTVSVSYSSGTLRITGYDEGGRYRLTLISANVTTYINLIIEYPAPDAISATANGTDTDSYNTYTGIAVTIAGSVTYGYDPGYTVAITSENASDATLSGDANTGYTFTSNTVGTYTLTVTSIADASVSDTIEIVVAEPPAISEILNGNYVYDVSNDYTGYFDTENVYIGFTPDSEGALSGTFSYYIATSYYGTFSGSTTYSYDPETGTFTLGEEAEGISLSLVSYSPVVTLTGTMYGRVWTITISGFVTTTEDGPTDSGGEDGDVNVAEAIIYKDWVSADWLYGLYFDEDGWGAVYSGSSYQFANAAIHFSWSIDENGDIAITPAPEDFVDFDPSGDLNIFNGCIGTFATYNATNDTISFYGVTFSELSWW